MKFSLEVEFSDFNYVLIPFAAAKRAQKLFIIPSWERNSKWK
jgi:hypothetical protein